MIPCLVLIDTLVSSKLLVGFGATKVVLGINLFYLVTMLIVDALVESLIALLAGGALESIISIVTFAVHGYC
jgi:hypothetical protein